MKNSVSIHPPYRIMFVSDDGPADTPEYRDRHITANEEALLIPCATENDQPTRITLVSSVSGTPNDMPKFDGFIKTPNKSVIVTTSLLDVVLRLAVPSTRTRLRVYANDVSVPDDILIVAD